MEKQIRDDLDQLAAHLKAAMPAGLQDVGSDLEKIFKDVLQNALSSCQLVTREEFDVQAKVLLRTREKLEALEKRVADLEKKCQ